MEILQDRIDAIVKQSKEDAFRIGKEDGIRIGKEHGLYLAKRILRMNAESTDYETIASQCMLSIDEVKDIFNF